MTNCQASRAPEPVILEPVEEGWYKPVQEKIDESYKKKLAWILGRLEHQQDKLQKITGWSGFNQCSSSNQCQVTMVGSLPIMNAPSHGFETLWTVIFRCKGMKGLKNGKYTVITMDEGVYNKFKTMPWQFTLVMRRPYWIWRRYFRHEIKAMRGKSVSLQLIMPNKDHCNVPLCSNSRSKGRLGITFHRFPVNKYTKKRWIVRIPQDVGKNFQISDCVSQLQDKQALSVNNLFWFTKITFNLID